MHSPTLSIHPSMQNNKIQLEYENAYHKEGLGKGGYGAVFYADVKCQSLIRPLASCSESIVSQ